ncbi:MAG TPA: DUF6531 domain-containing protein, partial [Microlunatus sp.]
MADLGAIDEDVPFDDGVADALIAACDGAAAKIEGQAGSRSSYVATASADFQGYFSRLFASNASVASADGTELAARLRQVATGARRLKSEAAKEQQRRQTARDWKREQDNRNIFEKGVDWAFGEDDPPVGPPAAEPTIPVSAAPTGHRETPSPGSGGGSDATSAARPSDLRSFASGSAELNQALSGLPSSLRAKYSDFAESCRWGRLSASSVFTGFDKWLSANDNDVSWAGTIAAAFDAAGGSGSVNSVANSALAAALNAAGVNATRQDLTIDPPQAYGHPPTTGYAMDPVNTSTGNFVETETDLGFSGAAAGLTLQRTYNSADQDSGAFGRGWTSVVESRIELSDEGASVVLPDGRRIPFARLGSGWDRADGENLWLTAEDDSLVMSDNDGRRWEFSRAGVWRSSSRGAGTRVSAVRDAAGRLVRLAHERGRFIDLVWSGERLIEAGASDGRGVRYGYDAAGRLLSVAGPAGTRSYRWNDADLIEAVIDGDGVVEAENSYDDQRRVATQRTPFGRLTRFAYLPGRVTVVSDADGTRSNTWIADRRGRLVGVVDSDEQRQAMSYDRNGNVVSVTERDGSVTVHSYDDRGRRVRTVTPSGADITYGHDEQDRVTTVVAESGAITSLEYADDDRNPSLVVDPEGGRTELEWSDGLLRRISDPTGVELRYDYDAHGDLVATTDADGQVARLERDEIGRVVAAVTPSGNRTSYAFDDRGYLVSRRDPDGAIWRYEHSAAGRLTAMVDPTGGRTTVEHGPHGRASTKIDPLGRSSTHRFDDLGNLIGAGLPDGSAWQFGYDGLSRLTEIVDPGGHQWRRDYNAAGELTAVIAPDGVRRSLSADRATGSVETDDGLARSGFAFDPLGRPISETGPDGSAALTSYDLCGRPVEQVDAEGGLTLLRRDAAGRVVERITPAGAGTRYEYGRCGRLSAVIDPLGGRTGLVYDVDGRLVQRILPTGESARYEYDRAGRVVARSEPGRGTARIGYDAAGRVVRIADSWFGRRRFRYDAAGQLVEAVNGNGGVTRYEYDLNGRMITITDPLGGVTTRRYDANDHLLAQTDPLGRTTTAGYDVAGRQLWQQDPEGHRTEWTHDASGRVASTVVDGRTVSEISRDLRARTVTITDRTDPGNVCTHVLGWNRRDQLTSRTRNGAGLSWEYDADGRRTAMVGPDGSRTNYAHDRAGRLIAVDHPLLGRADFDYDASGRLVQASAGQQLQSWQYADGRLSAHTVIDADGGSTLTTIERDDAGRIVALRTAGQVARFDHDEACQLIEARLADAHGGMRVSRWRYDPAGRLVAETVDTAAGTRYREHHYDAAGQLTETDDSAVGRTEYAYDLAGRRIRASAADGAGREFSWTASGWLSGITDHAADGRRRRTGLHVDATGELASVDDAAVWWDTAAGGLSSLVQIGHVPALSPGGGFNGLADDWRPSGWRPGRDGDLADPWMLADPSTDPLSTGSGA